jgi:transcriptional regulator with GAF, ATPase, and Fis domain
MADEPKLKTTSKKEPHQERLPWLRKFVGTKQRQPILSITEPLPPSTNPENSTLVLDQDSPFYLIKQLSTWIDRGFNVTAIMDNLLRGLIRTLHLDYAAYFVINPLEETTQLKMQFTTSGLKAIVATGYSVPLINDSILGWVFNQKHEHVLQNIKESRFTVSDWLLPTTTSQATFPLFANNQVIGFLDFQAHQSELFETSTLDLIRAIAIYLRGIFVQSEAIPAIQKENIGQVEQLMRQAKNFSPCFVQLLKNHPLYLCYSQLNSIIFLYNSLPIRSGQPQLLRFVD